MWHTEDKMPGFNGAAEADIDLVLELPCLIDFSGYSVQTRIDINNNNVPSKMEVYGSTDWSTWTLVGSYVNEKNWVLTETRNFTATTFGHFSVFKFRPLRTARGSSSFMSIADIILHAGGWIGDPADECTAGTHNCHTHADCTNMAGSFTCTCQSGYRGDGVSSCQTFFYVPPTDIGVGNDWTDDSTVLYEGVRTWYKDYSGVVCPGVYRVKSNKRWLDYNNANQNVATHPAKLFDHQSGAWSPRTMWNSETSDIAGTANANDANETFILDLPCKVSLYSYGIRARTDWDIHTSVSKMQVYGSEDEINWSFLGSFEGQTAWTLSEEKEFDADVNAGNFSYFKFVAQRISSTNDDWMGFGEILLYAIGWTELPNECLDLTDNCDANANCTDTAKSFECSCNMGFQGDGVTSCGDIDECSLPSHDCHADATCTNALGSFSCACNAGFTGTGVTCAVATDEIPPPDIDVGSLWSEDSSVTYNLANTFTTTYTGSLCPGLYRVGTNGGYRTSVTKPPGAFDSQLGPIATPWPTDAYWNGAMVVSGTGGPDTDLHLIVQLPCSLVMKDLEVYCAGQTYECVYKLEAFGSTSLTGPWTSLGLWSGLTWVKVTEGQTLSVNAAAAYPVYKFTLWRVSQGTTGFASIGDFRIQASSVQDVICGVDERVSSYACVTCAPGTTNAAGGHNASAGIDTSCNITYCAANEFVSLHACAFCPPGTNRPAGDDASGPDTSCDDDDECLLSTHNYNLTLGECTNTAGTFSCQCTEGFSGDGILTCTDIDECTLGAHSCHTDALCENTEGSFTCECTSPLEGDGLDCRETGLFQVSDICNATSSAAEIESKYIAERARIQAAGAQAEAFAVLDSKFEACLGSLSQAEGIQVLIGVLQSNLDANPTFPEDDRAALALLTSLVTLGDLISELSQTGTSVTVQSAEMLFLVATFNEATLSFPAETVDISFVLELNSASELYGEPLRGGFDQTAPPTWTSLLGAMDRTQRHFEDWIDSGQTGGDGGEGRRSVSLLASTDNPHPFAGGRTREGGFVLECAARFVRVQARQRRQVVGSSRVPEIHQSSFGRGGPSRAEGGRSGGRRLLTGSPFDAVEEIRIPQEEKEDTAGTLNIRVKGPDMSAVLALRKSLEEKWEEYRLGLREGEWILECAQLDVQQEVWTNAGCRFFLSGGEWWCACALRSLETTLAAVQRYVPPPSLSPTKGEAVSARGEKATDELPGLVAVLWLWILILAIFGGLGLLFLYATNAERDLSPSFKCLQSSTDALLLLSKREKAIKGEGKGVRFSSVLASLKEQITQEVFNSERHRRRLATFFSPRRLVAFLAARACMESGRGKQKEKGKVGIMSARSKRKRERAAGFFDVFFSCCRRLSLREQTLAFIDSRHLSRLREANLLTSSADVRGYLEGGEGRQRLMWRHLDAELVGRKHEMGLKFKSTNWDREEGRKSYVLPWETGVGRGSTDGQTDRFTSTRTFQTVRTETLAETVVESINLTDGISKAEVQQEQDSPQESPSPSSFISSSESEQNDELQPLSPSARDPRSFQPLGMVERHKESITSPASSQGEPPPRPPRWREQLPSGALLSGLRALRNSVIQTFSPSAVTRETPKAENETETAQSPSSPSEEWKNVMENLQHLSQFLSHKVEEDDDDDDVVPKESTPGEAERDEEEETEREGVRRELSDRPVTVEERVGRSKSSLSNGKAEEVEEEEESEESETDHRSPLVKSLSKSPWRKVFSESRFFPSEPPSPSAASPAASPHAATSKTTPPSPRGSRHAKGGAEKRLRKEKTSEERKERHLLKFIKKQREEISKTVQEVAEEDDQKRTQSRRPKMAIVAPQGYSRPGVLPLRARWVLWNLGLLILKSLDVCHVVLRLFQLPHVWLLTDVSPLTDTSLWALRGVSTLCVCFLLNALTVLVGETDEFHQPATPVTMSTAPSQFHLPSSMDLLSFVPAAGLKIWISFSGLLLVVGFFIRPFCARVWNEENLFWGVCADPEFASDSELDVESHDHSDEGQDYQGVDGREAKDKEAARKDRDISPVSAKMAERTLKKRRTTFLLHTGIGGRRRCSFLGHTESNMADVHSSTSKGRLLYYNFGPAMGMKAEPVRLLRAPCALRFVSRRRMEILCQRLLLGLFAVMSLAYLCLLVVATAEWRSDPDGSGESGGEEGGGEKEENSIRLCKRRPAVVLAEHSVCILIFFLLEILFGGLQALCRAVLLRASLRLSLARRLLNCFPRAAMLPDLHPEAKVHFGRDVVKPLDATPTSNWVVPYERFDMG